MRRSCYTLLSVGERLVQCLHVRFALTPSYIQLRFSKLMFLILAFLLTMYHVSVRLDARSVHCTLRASMQDTFHLEWVGLMFCHFPLRVGGATVG